MTRWLPVALGLAGAAVSAIGLTEPSVWYDEAATVSGATRSLPQLVALLGNVDAVHGAYYLLMHAVFEVVGYSPLSLRIVSVVAVGIATGLVAVLDRRLRPGSFGILAALVFCALPRVGWMAGEGRSFAVSAAVAALLTLLLLRALASTRRAPWVLYGIVAFLGCVLFLYFALVVLAHGLTVALRGRRMLAPWALAAGTAALALVPFLLVVAGESSQLPSMPPLGVHTAHDVLVAQWFGSSAILAAAAWALVALGFVRDRHTVLPVALPALIIPTVLLLGGALVNPELYQPRYLGMCAPFVALGIAAGLGALRVRALRLVAVAAVVALAVPVLVAGRAVDAKKDVGWRAVAAIVEGTRAEAGASEVAVVYGALFPHSATTARVISVAYPEAFAGTVDVTLGVPAREYPDDLWGTWLPLSQSLDRLASADTVILITTAALDRPGSDDAVLRDAGWAPQRTWHEGGVTVVQYDR